MAALFSHRRGCIFILIPLSKTFLRPLASSRRLGSLIIVGACLRFWVAKGEFGWKFSDAMALLPLPLTTVIHSGFLGYGVGWVIAISTFPLTQSKRRIGYFFFAPVVFYIGLSVFVTYMAARDEIRQTVWHEQAGIGRLEKLLMR